MEVNSSNFSSLCHPKPQIFIPRRDVPPKCTEPSVDPPYWCTTVVHQNGGRKACKHLNLLWLPRPLAICNEQTIIYINTFPNTLSSQMAKSHELSTYFLTNSTVTLCHSAPQL